MLSYHYPDELESTLAEVEDEQRTGPPAGTPMLGITAVIMGPRATSRSIGPGE